MKEERTYDPVPDDFDKGVVRYLRDVPPAHYSVKMESFSRLVNSGTERWMSSMFDAGGYTWRLILYPNGKRNSGGGGHISLYLAAEKTDSLPLGWEVYVSYKMFVFDHKKDQYLTIQDDPVHQIRRFHRAKKERGFDRLISLETFNAGTNGYLINDSCVFGVEVHEVKNTGNGETIKIFDDPTEFTFDWKICELSKICKEKVRPQKLDSEVFTGGKWKWRLVLYPNGDSSSSSRDHLSVYIYLVESPTSSKKVAAEFSVMIKNQISDCHRQNKSKETWFSTDAKELTSDTTTNMGWAAFMSLSELTKKSSGFIVNDTLLLQAKVNIKTEVAGFS